MPASVVAHWWPVTQDFGLVRADVQRVAEARSAQYRAAGLDVAVTALEEPLDHCFARLEPLSPAPSRELFLATSFGWTAFFQNGARGSDPDLPMMQLSRTLGVTTLRACITAEAARYPAVILAIYDTPAAGGDADHNRRAIVAGNDGGRWTFEQHGAPYPFEDLAKYLQRRTRDRFTADMLWSYLGQLGIPVLDDAVLEPDGQCRGFLLSRPVHTHLPQYTLAEAKAL